MQRAAPSAAMWGSLMGSSLGIAPEMRLPS